MIKAIVILTLLLVILAVPFAALSNWGLGIAEKYALESKSPVWQWRIANLYSWTLREEKAVQAYTSFMEHYASDPLYPEAKYRRAVCYIKTGTRDKAIAELNEFAHWYPEHPYAEEARKRAGVLRYTR